MINKRLFQWNGIFSSLFIFPIDTHTWLKATRNAFTRVMFCLRYVNFVPFRGFTYFSVKTCEVFLCFVAIVRDRVYYVYFFGFFVLRHW